MERLGFTPQPESNHNVDNMGSSDNPWEELRSIGEAEKIQKKVKYTGVFVDPDELFDKVGYRLDHRVDSPHVTTAFKPGADQINLGKLGAEAKITAIGYGNDGENEGLLVRVESDYPVVQEACDALKTPHITLSVSENGHARNTAFLDFQPLSKPFEVTGRYGVYVKGKPYTNQRDLEAEAAEKGWI